MKAQQYYESVRDRNAKLSRLPRSEMDFAFSTRPGSDNCVIGSRFSRLVVIGHQFRTSVNWHVVLDCDCGNTTVQQVSLLTIGKAKSCGCLKNEKASNRLKKLHSDGLSWKKHGMSKTRLYKIWTGMKDRCHNKNSCDWGRYGGRGIAVCESWRGSFVKFAEWAIENGYKENLTIDREDNDLGYSPENCRWIPSTENSARAHLKHGKYIIRPVDGLVPSELRHGKHLERLKDEGK